MFLFDCGVTHRKNCLKIASFLEKPKLVEFNNLSDSLIINQDLIILG